MERLGNTNVSKTQKEISVLRSTGRIIIIPRIGIYTELLVSFADAMRAMILTPESINLPGNINDVYVTMFDGPEKKAIYSFMRGGVTAESDPNVVTCKIFTDLLYRTYGISVRSAEATASEFPKYKITIKTDGRVINDVIVGIGRGPDPEVQVSGPDYETERLIYGLFAGNDGKASKGCAHYFSMK